MPETGILTPKNQFLKRKKMLHLSQKTNFPTKEEIFSTYPET